MIDVMQTGRCLRRVRGGVRRTDASLLTLRHKRKGWAHVLVGHRPGEKGRHMRSLKSVADEREVL